MNDEALGGPNNPIRIEATINGRVMVRHVPARMSLASFLREEIGTTSVHLGCEQGICGACTVVYDGVCARSCLMLAPQADGAVIETVEGASAPGRLADLQAAFVEHAALQCGFCTPGMLLSADEILARRPGLDRRALREALSGNICRCTGYESIIDAVEAVGRARLQAARTPDKGPDHG